MTDKLQQIAEFLVRLTLARVLLGMLFAAGTVILYALWEVRSVWAGQIWQSQQLLVALLVGGTLIAVGAAMQSLQKRVDQQHAALYQQMRDQLGDLRQQVDLGAQERRLLQTQVTDLTAAEAACDALVKRLREDMDEFRRQSGFGGLSP